MEAIYRDYGPKGVDFYFVYKSLAHPELVGDYVQPFTLEERLEHARQAEKQLGATVPWLVDAMDNRLKHALGDRPNSEFVVDPNGIIVAKRPWSYPAQVRKDLEKMVGPVEHITREEDIHLAMKIPLKTDAARGVLPPLKRPDDMRAIEIDPQIREGGLPFYAKLRAEADSNLLRTGKGKLYIGFKLDPFHDAHWNNLTKPLSYRLDLPEGISVEQPEGSAPKVEATSDADPREFLVDVDAWPAGKPLKLNVRYFACLSDERCLAVQQDYLLHRKRDRDAGRARGVGAGYWIPEDFARQMLARDENNDGKLNQDEVQGLVLPFFNDFDTDQDHLLDLEELKAVADWLNYHHEAGAGKVEAQ
jgi:hypothetical protein